MRLFVALVPPPEVVAALPPAPSGLRPIPRHRIHLTLAFLDEQPSSTPLERGLAVVAALPAPRLGLSGSGAFGSAVWLGLTGELDALAALADTVRAAVSSTGVALEDRPWRPHLTIGRGRRSAELRAYLGPVATWREVRLVHSRPGGGDGVRHETVASWELR